MRQSINLFIGDLEVEFSQVPEILYTYTQDELINPTIIKNGFSKTITIQGTPNNNQIFGHFWNLERIQDYGAYTGVYFNASKKTPFTIYVNGNVYESGYVKLTQVRKTHNGLEYDIDLYGGLGQFFNGLNENKENGSKLRLCDLDYRGTDNSETEFDFLVDKNTIKDAWFTYSPYASESSVYHYLNFIPCYNGIPSKDFNADKVLINGKDAPINIITKADADGNPVTNPRAPYSYHTYNGYVYASLSQKMTEWEMGDLRSGYQRPAIRMKEIVNACRKYMEKPENGSWTVDLDPDFFNQNNPYWEDTWMTLPMLSEVNYINDEELIDYTPTITITKTDQQLSRGWTKYQIDGIDQKVNTATFSIHYGLNSTNSMLTHNELFVSQVVNYRYGGFLGIGRKDGTKYYDGAICIRLEAVNELGRVVAASNWAYLTNKRGTDYNWGLANDRTLAFTEGYETGINQYAGSFKKVGSKHYWCAENSNEPLNIILDLDIQGNTYSTIRLDVKWMCSSSIDRVGNNGVLYETSVINRNRDDDSDERTYTGVVTYERAEVAYLDSTTISGGKLLSGKVFGKKDILNTSSSPAEYLISYCKLFNLHFLKDVNENHIQILTRKNYYLKDNVVNLEEVIDRSKEINIHPQAFDKQWYDFKLPMVEGQFAQDYKATTSYDFGVKRINTGYEFDGDTKDLLSGTTFKNAIECVEKSKYFSYVGENDDGRQPWMLDGFSYNLVSMSDSNDTIEIKVDPENFVVNGVSDFYKYYDLYPKLQLHQDENKGIDGANILVFFNGYQDLISTNGIRLNYWISDDVGAMVGLGGNSCWLYTNSEINGVGDEVAIKITSIPKFERYRMNGYNIAHSLDFGEPRQLYCPHYITRENSTIYYNYWKTYIEDLYDVNTRVLDCYVKLEDKPNPEWLRRFYWFDNAIWRINKIEDWNISSFETTKMQFIKVQDMNNYSSNITSDIATIHITADKYFISNTGETVTFTVTVSDGGCWFGDDNWDYYLGEIPRGCGDSTTFSMFIPACPEGRVIKLNVIGDLDQYGNGVEITQSPILFTVRQFAQFVYDNVPQTGGTCLYGVKSSSPWTVVSDKSYCTPLVNGGTGNTQYEENLEVVWTENFAFGTRSATLTFTDSFGNVITKVKVQNGITSISLDYGAEGGTQVVEAPSGGTVTQKPTWVTVIDNGDGTYDIITDRNTGDARTGTVIIHTDEGDFTIYVNQEGREIPDVSTQFSVVPDSLTFLYNGGTDYVTINNLAGYGWRARLLDDGFGTNWLTLSETQGTTSASIAVTASAYDYPSWRRAAIEITNTNGETYTVAIWQNGDSSEEKALYVTPSTITLPYSGGSTTVELEYRYRGGDFVTCNSPYVGAINFDGNFAYVVVTVNSVNNSLSPRTYTATFVGNGVSATLTIIQEGRPAYLNVYPTDITFNSTGGTATVTIETNDGPWTIE